VSVGPLEIVIVLVLALLVFGPRGLPQAGRSLGQAMREFRKAAQTARTELGLDELTEGVNDLKSSVKVDLGLDEVKSAMNVDLGLGDVKSALSLDLKGAAAPPADKPVPVTAAGSDTTPPGAAAEPAGSDESAAAEAAAESEPAEPDSADSEPAEPAAARGGA
jgi:TatA/E family protein of Tat protein translocase